MSEERFDRLEGKLSQLITMVGHMQNRMDGMEKKMNGMENKMGGMENKMVACKLSKRNIV